MANALKGSDLYDLTTKIMLGVSIDVTLFYQLLSQAQARIETMREWAILKKSDISQVANASDSFLTPKTLAPDFNFWQTEDPLILYRANSPQDFLQYQEVPFANRYFYQSDPWKYAVDYANFQFYLLGQALPSQYIIQQNYIYKPADVAQNTSWVFPNHFHPVLAYEVGVMYELGTDYDDLKQATGGEKVKIRDSILEQMINWDARLQTQSLNGVNRGQFNPHWPIAGRININD